MENPYDRTQQDFGNAIGLEHLNVTIPSQRVASEFYLVGMGFTRDPYLFPGNNNMWVNIGKNQFHLPTGDPQVFRGHIGVVVPDLELLAQRLNGVKKALDDTKFACKEHNDHIEATCPWGNKFKAYAPDLEKFGPVNLGVPYVEFEVPEGAADGIARFYREILGCITCVQNGDGRTAVAMVGPKQCLKFRETDKPVPAYDGHHLQIYVADFSTPHDLLAEHDLITEESDPFQYRFKDIVCLDTGKCLFQIEHEVRSVTHPLYGRHLVNRNPNQTNRNYRVGDDEWNPSLPVPNERIMPAAAPAPAANEFTKRRARRLAM